LNLLQMPKLLNLKTFLDHLSPKKTCIENFTCPGINTFIKCKTLRVTNRVATNKIKILLYILFFNSLTVCSAIAEQIPFVTQQQVFQTDFKQPNAVRVDNNDHIFVLDGLKQRIVVFGSKTNVLHQIALSLTDNDKLLAPMDMLLLDESILIADTGNYRLVEFNLQGNELQSIDLKSLFSESEKAPEPVALWLENDLLYWSDRANHQICQMQLSTKKLIRCFGRYGEGKNQFRFPFQLAADRDGYLHSVDVLNGRILIFNSKGKLFSQIGRFGLRPGELFRPNGLAVNKEDFVFISDSYLGYISVYKLGRFVTYLMNSNNIPIHFETPVYLSLKKNKLFVVDALQNSIVQLNLSYKEQEKLSAQSKQSSSKSLAAQPISSRKSCISCHISWDNEWTLQSMHIADNKVLPVASEKMCYSCHHGVVVESRIRMLEKHQHPSIYHNKASAEKIKEKESEAKRIRDKPKDKTADVFPLSDNKELLCSTCHTPHNSDENQEVLYSDHTNSWMRISNQDGNLCERCHESKSEGARAELILEQGAKQNEGINHPLAIKFLPAATKNTKAYAKETHLQHGLPEVLIKNGSVLDKQQQLICQTCHQIHAGEGKDLLTLSNSHSELCISCHKSKYAQGKEKSHQKGIHPVNIDLEQTIEYKGKKITSVNCASCHKVHDGAPGTALLPKKLAKQAHELCIACHKDKHSDNPEEAHQQGIHPVNFKLENPIQQEGKKIHEITCSSCHSMHDGQADSALFPHTTHSKKIKDKQQALCVSCHQQQFAKDKQQARQKGIHPVNVKLEKAIKYKGKIIKEVSCASCHKVHNGQLNTALLMEGKEQNIEELCTICHQDHSADNLDESIQKGIHPVNIKLEKPVKINKKNIKTITCLSCHSVHHGEKQTASLVQSDSNGELCKTCHQDEQKILNSDHDLRLTAADQKNKQNQLPEQAGLCGSCHSMHKNAGDKQSLPFLSSAKIVPPDSQQEQGMDQVLFQRDQLCINCHQDNGIAKEKVVNHFSHPYKDLILRSDPKQMPLLKVPEIDNKSVHFVREEVHEFGAIACITCHNPHSWEPDGLKKEKKIKKDKNIEGNSNNSFLHQSDIKGTFCVSCHGIEARIEYKYYHNRK
jgi:predicted CXXCH cytochrome family protein